MGCCQLAPQAFDLLGELGHAPSFGDGRIGLAPALLRLERGAFGGLALLAPGGEIGGIDVLAAQQRPDFAHFSTAVRSLEDAVLLATRELASSRHGRHFWIRCRYDGGVCVHGCFHLVSHDLNLPFLL